MKVYGYEVKINEDGSVKFPAQATNEEINYYLKRCNEIFKEKCKKQDEEEMRQFLYGTPLQSGKKPRGLLTTMRTTKMNIGDKVFCFAISNDSRLIAKYGEINNLQTNAKGRFINIDGSDEMFSEKFCSLSETDAIDSALKAIKSFMELQFFCTNALGKSVSDALT